MAAVQSKIQRLWDRIAVALVLALLVIMMIPLYWIGSTAFKPRADATTVPPTVFFKPEITAFIKLFTSRVERRGAPNKEEYAKAPWWEKLVMDGDEHFFGRSHGNGDRLWIFPLQNAGRVGLAVFYSFHPHVASSGGGYSDVSHVSHRCVSRYPYRTDHPLHRVQSIVLGLGDERFYR